MKSMPDGEMNKEIQRKYNDAMRNVQKFDSNFDQISRQIESNVVDFDY